MVDAPNETEGPSRSIDSGIFLTIDSSQLTLLLSLLAVASLLYSGLMLRQVRRVRRFAHVQLEAVVAAGEGVLVVDAEGRIQEARGAASSILLDSFESTSDALPRLPTLLEKGLFDSERRHLRVKAGGGRVLEIWADDPGERPVRKGLRGVLVRDITTQRRDERELIRLARHDSLTGLANRRLFLEDLKRHVEAASTSDDALALLYIDLDHFKEVNDSLGHGGGDELLQKLASRLLERLRPDQFDSATLPTGSQVRVARLSGDEFAIIVSKIADAEAARKFADRVLQLIALPTEIGSISLTPSGSVGIALFPKDGNSVEGLIRSADVAVYAAKNRGRNRLAFYEHSIDAAQERGSNIAQALRRSIDNSELQLCYQPKVDLATGITAGFEALLRWKNSELGVVRPGEFIPIAEDRGLISEIGAWCLQETCQQIRRWRDAGFVAVPVSVNVSSIQFRDNDLQRIVGEALRMADVEPELLELELTESLLLDDGEETALCLRDLRSIGVRIALDDFGTGYSALTYLNRFPLDVLKMDRGFLREIHFDSSAARIASAVVSMAHGLGLTVVAEGVDSEEQIAVLREMRCDQIQGFLYSPAIPADSAQRYLARPGTRPPLVPYAEGHSGKLPEIADEAELGMEPALKSAPDAPSPASAAKENPRLLLVDDEALTLQALAMRLMRLGGVGVDLHYASDIDEARLMINDAESRIHALTVSPSIDLDEAENLRKALTRELGSQAPLIVIGEEPDASMRSRLRKLGEVCVLWSPFDDTELAFVLKAALTPRAKLARRLDVRVPINLTVKLQIGQRKEIVVLSSLSTNGAFLEISDPLPVGTSIRIGFNLPSDSFSCFARVLYYAEEDPECPFSNSGVGVSFFSVDRTTELGLRKAVDERASRYLP